MENIIKIKSQDDWELDVLIIPYGDEHNKDSDNQFFTERTNLYLENFTNPMVLYYHAYDENGYPIGDPDNIGKFRKYERRRDGLWARVVLDKLSSYAKRVWESAKEGMARASSGSLPHVARWNQIGEILNWPLVEISLFDMGEGRQPANKYAVALPVAKARWKMAGLELPEINVNVPEEQVDLKGEEQSESTKSADTENLLTKNLPSKGKNEMEEKDVQELVEKALKADREQREAEAKKAKEEQEKIDLAVKTEKEKWEKEVAEKQRLADGAPYVTKFQDVAKFDNYETADLDLVAGILNGRINGSDVKGASQDILKSLAIRHMEGKDEANRHAMKALKKNDFRATKADEVMQQDLTSYGDEWVGVGYGTELWRNIRQETNILSKIPQREIPQGFETFYDPIEGADPTWYKVPETTDTNATTGFPNATVTASRKGTSRVGETLAKIGARTIYSGELKEDSLLDVAAELRLSMQLSGMERIEHLLIDGDTDATASTNINDIAGTPGTTDLFLAINGFRKLALITNTANSRSAGGAFAVEDFKNTAKLMGTAGGDALDVTKVGFIIDLPTHWKALELPEIKTRDTFISPVLEEGKLAGIYGYKVLVSPFMHYMQSDRKANSAGKVDQDTAGNNLYGAILAVRWDQWKFGWKRRATMEATRTAFSDSWEIISMMRFGFKYRSTEASAITYYVGV